MRWRYVSSQGLSDVRNFQMTVTVDRWLPVSLGEQTGSAEFGPLRTRDGRYLEQITAGHFLWNFSRLSQPPPRTVLRQACRIYIPRFHRLCWSRRCSTPQISRSASPEARQERLLCFIHPEDPSLVPFRDTTQPQKCRGQRNSVPPQRLKM